MAVSERVQAEIALLGAGDTVEAQVALRLALQLDEPRNGMAVAGDAKQLLAVMEAVRLNAVKGKADSVDDSRDETDRILRSVG